MTQDPPQDHLTPQYLQVAIELLFTAASRAFPEWTEVLWLAQFDGNGWPMLNAPYNGDQTLKIPFWLASDDLTILEEAVARCRRALQMNRLEPWQVVVASVTAGGSFQWRTLYDDDARLAGLVMMPDTMEQAEAGPAPCWPMGELLARHVCHCGARRAMESHASRSSQRVAVSRRHGREG